MSGSLEKRIADLERRAKNRNSGVGVILPPSADGAWELYFDGKKRTFPTENEAKTTFSRMAGPNAVLIIW